MSGSIDNLKIDDGDTYEQKHDQKKSSDSNDSETCSFSYPGNQMKQPEPTTLTKRTPYFRRPVRVLRLMNEALKQTGGASKGGKVTLQSPNEETVSSSHDGISPLTLDNSATLLLEKTSEADSSAAQEVDSSVSCSVPCQNTDANSFEGMSWLMESGRKHRTTLKTQEQPAENKPQHATQPSRVNHQYIKYSTPQTKHLSHLAPFKEISNFDLKSTPSAQQNWETPMKSDLVTGSYNEHIVSSSCYSVATNTLCNPGQPEFSANKSAVYTKHVLTAPNDFPEHDSNVKHHANVALKTKQVLQEIPEGDISSKTCSRLLKVQPAASYGCPVKFSRVVDNQNKENEALVEAHTDEPLNLNMKDLTGHSEHHADSKMNSTKPESVWKRQPSQHVHPTATPAKTNQSPAESIPHGGVKHPATTPSPPTDPTDPVPRPPPSADNVMFSLPATRAVSSLLCVNGKTYAVVGQLGAGGSSKVYQVMDGGVTYAVKAVDLAGVDPAIARGYINEIELLKKLQHCDSVIRLLGYEYIKKTKTLLVVMEKGDTDFSNFLRDINKTKKISALMIAYYWTEMVTAVDNIHKNGIIHSDLKPPNFLLVSGRLKLIDFGIASSINVDMTSVVKDQMMGTFNYMSPEAIGALHNAAGANAQARKITFKSDVWSLGCILYNLVFGRTPFAHVNGIGKLVEIFNPHHVIDYPDVDYPPVLVSTIKRCLAYDPKQRPSTAELLQPPLMPKLEDPFLMARVQSLVTPQVWAAINGNDRVSFPAI